MPTITTNKSKTSQCSYIYDVNIQPAFCGQTLGEHSFGASDADCIDSSDKIIVYYQKGDSFHFTILKSLKVTSIIFDALDSSLFYTESYLKENAQWCVLKLDKTRILIILTLILLLSDQFKQFKLKNVILHLDLHYFNLASLMIWVILMELEPWL